MLWLLSVFLVDIIQLVNTCPILCSCRDDVVDCSLRGLKSIPPEVPTSTRHLDLHGNDITYISARYLTGMSSLITLDLSENKIHFFDVDVFRDLQRLKYLDLSKNRLDSLPSGLHLLGTLHTLDLRSNSISSLSLDNISFLESVRNVDLSRNLISQWPTGLFKQAPVLEKLDISHNLIYTLPARVFSSLYTLKYLHLSHNKITSLDRESFQGLSALKSINLSRNKIRFIPSLAFNSLQSLQNLSLARNEIHRIEDGVFLGCESLSHLNVSSNKIHLLSDGWLFGLNKLQYLDISQNHISSIDPGIWKQCTKLRWLSLCNNRLQSLPSGAFRYLYQLEHLILSGNSLESLHNMAMTGLNKLNSIDLSSNNLANHVEDGSVLYNGSMPYLKFLKFSDNNLKVIPTRAFSRFFALEELDLSDNPIATMYRDAFEPLNLRKLFLNTSSLLCDCHVSWFANWLSVSSIDRLNIVARCAHPHQLFGIDVVAIDTSNLTCVSDSPRTRIILHPAAHIRTVKNNANLSCSGYGQAPLHIEWRVIKDGKPRNLWQDGNTIITTNHTRIFNGTVSDQEIVVSELILLNVGLIDRAEYQCVIKNRFSIDYSNRTFLEVQQLPTFVHKPNDVSLLIGQNARIICAATGLKKCLISIICWKVICKQEPNFKIFVVLVFLVILNKLSSIFAILCLPLPVMKWTKDGGSSFPAATEHRLYVKPNDDHLYVMNVSVKDQGVYTCHASNEAGSIQASATLRVFGNSFHSNLASVHVFAGETILLDCLVDLLLGSQRMIWTKDNESLYIDDDRTVLKAQGQVLLIRKAQLSDSGRYVCELWADNNQLARQTTSVYVEKYTIGGSAQNAKFSPIKDDRGIHLLSVPLIIALLSFIIYGLSWSFIYFRRARLGRRRLVNV